MTPPVGGSLFGAAVAAGGTKRGLDGAAGAPAEKRQSLRRYEHVAPQVLQIAGVSPIHECSNQQLWTFTNNGNKGVEFFSEYCAKEDYRRGVAGSRHAESMLAFGDVLKEPLLEKLLQKSILDKVREEFAKHEGALTILNGGKTSGGNSKSFMTMCQESIKKNTDEVAEAAGAIHDWLSEENSAVQGFLQVMSWGGIFYAAMCSDKTARCAIDPTCGDITKEKYQAMMVARLCGSCSDKVDGGAAANTMAKRTNGLFGT